MWKKKEEKKEVSLLKELCGDDAILYDFLTNCLHVNPLISISEKGLDILIAEAEQSGNFRDAVDKAIFEGAQNPGSRERYIKVIQNIASKTIHVTEQEKEKVEKKGLTDRTASLVRIIENQKFMSERAEDILNVASKYYNEQLVELGENVRREVRGEARWEAESKEMRAADLEKERREAIKKEEKGMGREEKREAKKQDKREELTAVGRKEARVKERREAENEERKIEEQEKAGREARKEERGGN